MKLLDENLIAKSTTGESKVFYQKMKADYYRYIAEFTDGDKKKGASENARQAYEEAQKVKKLHPHRKLEADTSKEPMFPPSSEMRPG